MGERGMGAMAKRLVMVGDAAGKRRAMPLEMVADFGPKHQRATPLAKILKAKRPEEVPGRLAVVDAPDPDAPNRTVRRARVRYHYDELHARGGLTDGEREAADCWLVLREMEAGGRNRPEVNTGRTPP